MKSFNLIAIAVILSFSVSCITAERCAKYYPPQVTKTDSVKITVRETLHDTIIEVASDSSWLKAWIECDSLGQAKIKELIDYKDGQRSQIPRVSLHNNILTADCKCDSVNIHAILKSRETVIDHQSAITTTPPAVQVKFIPGWMWFFGITGMISWGVLVILIVFSLVKSKFKLWL